MIVVTLIFYHDTDDGVVWLQTTVILGSGFTLPCPFHHFPHCIRRAGDASVQPYNFLISQPGAPLTPSSPESSHHNPF